MLTRKMTADAVKKFNDRCLPKLTDFDRRGTVNNL
jgi:hypothetical protein